MSWVLLPVASALLFALALSDAVLGDLAIGAVLGLVLAALSRPTRLGPGAWLARIAWSPVLALGILGQIASGIAWVGARILGLRSAGESGAVEVPIGPRSDAGAILSALVATLSPGSLLLAIDRERGVIRFHVIDASDPEAFCTRQQDFYRRYQRRVVP